MWPARELQLSTTVGLSIFVLFIEILCKFSRTVFVSVIRVAVGVLTLFVYVKAVMRTFIHRFLIVFIQASHLLNVLCLLDGRSIRYGTWFIG